MNKSWIPLTAIVLSALACVLAGMALLQRADVPVIAATGASPDSMQVQDLSKRVAELRADLDRLTSSKLENPEPHMSRESSAAPIGIAPEVEKRLASLEASVANLSRQLKDRSAAAPAAQPDLNSAKLAATDPRTSEQDKLAALKTLRGKMVDGKDARSHDVVLAMIQLAEQSADENVREDVYKNLHGASDPALRNSMLHALASDASAMVRAKVAQDIDTFLPDAQVTSALQQAADFDPDPKVREQAAKTLAHGH